MSWTSTPSVATPPWPTACGAFLFLFLLLHRQQNQELVWLPWLGCRSSCTCVSHIQESFVSPCACLQRQDMNPWAAPARRLLVHRPSLLWPLDIWLRNSMWHATFWNVMASRCYCCAWRAVAVQLLRGGVHGSHAETAWIWWEGIRMGVRAVSCGLSQSLLCACNFCCSNSLVCYGPVLSPSHGG